MKKVDMKKQQPDRLKRLEDRIVELENNWKRALADYKNLEQRTQKLRTDAMLFATQELLRKILKILDDLDLALVHHPQEAWVTSLRNDLFRILSDEGLGEIDALGTVFDPQLMECIQKAPGTENTVVKVVLKGYKLHEVVLRPAKVEVGHG